LLLLLLPPLLFFPQHMVSTLAAGTPPTQTQDAPFKMDVANEYIAMASPRPYDLLQEKLQSCVDTGCKFLQEQFQRTMYDAGGCADGRKDTCTLKLDGHFQNAAMGTALRTVMLTMIQQKVESSEQVKVLYKVNTCLTGRVSLCYYKCDAGTPGPKTVFKIPRRARLCAWKSDGSSAGCIEY